VSFFHITIYMMPVVSHPPLTAAAKLAYHPWYAGFAVADDGHPVDDSCHHRVVD